MYFALSFTLRMQNRISYYILSLLHLNGSVKIPGLGKTEQKQLPAREQDGTDMMLPPQTGTSFTQLESPRTGLLERYIAYKTNLSRTKVRKELLQYSQQVRDTARNEGSADLQYLGTVSGTDSLSFQARQEFLNPGHSALHATHLPRHIRPDLIPEDTAESASESLVPAFVSSWPDQDEGEHHSEDVEIPSETVGPESQNETAPEPTAEPSVIIPDAREPLAATASAEPDPEPKQRNSRLWLLPLLAVLLLAVGFTAFFLVRRDKVDTSPPDLVLNQDVVTEEIAEVDKPDPVVDDISGSGAEILPDGLSTESPSASVPLDEIPEASAESEPIASSEVVGNLTGNSTASNTSESQECLIVVGAFSLTANADRMTELLRSLGYEVRSVQRGKLAQIGVPVDCSAEHISDVTATLRNTVEASAWLLRPQ
jgi:hypothetical protein